MPSSVFVDFSTSSPVSYPITAALGGTGISSYTIGDLLSASASTTLAKIAAVASGSVLASAGIGVVPVWTSTPSFSGSPIVTLDAVGTTPTDGTVLRNTTAATVSVTQQMAPRLRWQGNAWDTNDTVSRSVAFSADMLPVNGNTVTGFWRILASIDGGAPTTPLTLTDSGALALLAGLTCTNVVASGVLQAGASNFIGWAGFTRLVSTGDGTMQLYKNGLTIGVGLDFSTDAIVKVRTTNQAAYATVDALGYSVGGVAGASKGAGGVTSITVVNGIVTAIS